MLERFSKGQRNFNKCPHSEVEFTLRRGSLVTRATLNCPATEERETPVFVRPGDIRWSDTLYEYTDSGYYRNADGKGSEHIATYRGQEGAVKHLARSAGKLVCGSCPYVNMTGLEVSDALANQAEEKLRIAENDLRRMQALEGLKRAYEGIAALEMSAGLRTPQLPVGEIAQQ